MNITTFRTARKTETAYIFASAGSWATAFAEWFRTRPTAPDLRHIVVVSDRDVWAYHGAQVQQSLSALDVTVVPLLFEPGEDSKDFTHVAPLLQQMANAGVHRRDIVVCFGGGVCCDLGGLLAMLYMRGLTYACVPTSMMAMVDGAIGGKVGANLGLRKNIFGGFHHPELVLIDPAFLATLAPLHLHSALAEVVKLAIIDDDTAFLTQLINAADQIARRDTAALESIVRFSVSKKLALLQADPFETDLDRKLNFGHSVAHAIERIKLVDTDRYPTHGEAVAVGIATKVRYCTAKHLCSEERALSIISTLKRLDLPTRLHPAVLNEVRSQLAQIPAHRGGSFRIVLPTGRRGVTIFREVDLDCLAHSVLTVDQA